MNGAKLYELSDGNPVFDCWDLLITVGPGWRLNIIAMFGRSHDCHGTWWNQDHSHIICCDGSVVCDCDCEAYYDEWTLWRRFKWSKYRGTDCAGICYGDTVEDCTGECGGTRYR